MAVCLQCMYMYTYGYMFKVYTYGYTFTVYTYGYMFTVYTYGIGYMFTVYTYGYMFTVYAYWFASRFYNGNADPNPHQLKDIVPWDFQSPST